MLRPDRASTMKQLAVIQCTKRSNALKRTSVRPDRAVLDAHHAADQIEQDQHRQHAEDGNGSDPAQRHLVELAPIAAGGLLQHARPRIRKRAAPLDFVQLLQKLPLLDRLRHRIDFGRLLRLLRHGWRSECSSQTERQSGDQKSKRCAHRRHSIISLLPASPDGRVIEATGWLPPPRELSLRTRSSRDRPSASPMRQTCSHAAPRAPCRFAR